MLGLLLHRPHGTVTGAAGVQDLGTGTFMVPPLRLGHGSAPQPSCVFRRPSQRSPESRGVHLAARPLLCSGGSANPERPRSALLPEPPPHVHAQSLGVAVPERSHKQVRLRLGSESSTRRRTRSPSGPRTPGQAGLESTDGDRSSLAEQVGAGGRCLWPARGQAASPTPCARAPAGGERRPERRPGAHKGLGQDSGVRTFPGAAVKETPAPQGGVSSPGVDPLRGLQASVRSAALSAGGLGTRFGVPRGPGALAAGRPRPGGAGRPWSVGHVSRPGRLLCLIGNLGGSWAKGALECKLACPHFSWDARESGVSGCEALTWGTCVCVGST